MNCGLHSFPATPQAAIVAYGTQQFDSSGIFTVPNGVNLLRVTLWGAGGGGACSDGNGPGCGGGAGGCSIAWVNVASGEQIVVTIGAGGVAGVSQGSGGNGGDSYFGSYLYAGGGYGGPPLASVTSGARAPGGYGNLHPGQEGCHGSAYRNMPHGGSAGGPGGGAGGQHNPSSGNGTVGPSGASPGGGGAGGFHSYANGGAGANGRCFIEWGVTAQ